MTRRKLPSARLLSVISVIIGMILILASTPIVMSWLQSRLGIKENFILVGQASIPVSQDWLLVDARPKPGGPHLRLGLFPGKSDKVPKTKYYSFRDITLDGSVTFIELDSKDIARLDQAVVGLINCQSLSDSKWRRLLKCSDGDQAVSLYDLDRGFVAVIAPKIDPLLTSILSAIDD